MIVAYPFWRWTRLPLAVGVASVLSGPAMGVAFNVGDVEGQIDTRLTLGAGWALDNPSRNLIGANSGGKGLSSASDDGRQNFHRGDTFSKRFQGEHDLELRYRDSGLFLSGRYWYDFELKDEGQRFKNVEDGGRQRLAKSSGTQLLDAYLYHNYQLGEQPGIVRVGRQKVTWGESQFISGGIDAINPRDAMALRKPDARVSEGRLPVNMLYLSQNLTDDLSAEAFYQLQWAPSVQDNCGTFFSQSDYLAPGCTDNLRVLQSARGLSPGSLATLTGQGVAVNDEGVLVPRGHDREARNGGQFGLALHYRIESLDTDVGGYFMNYHSRDPLFSTTAAGLAAYTGSADLPANLRAAAVAGQGRYFVEYPEDIQLYGVSFATTLATGTQWRGELSYRPNAPVQLNTNDVLNAALGPLGGELGQASPLQAVPGADVQGYRRKEVTQLQTSLTQVFDQVMGARQMTLVGEVGMTYVGGLESASEARYGRDPVYGPGALPVGAGGDACAALNAGTLAGAGQSVSQANLSRHCDRGGFTTRTAWGYRTQVQWDYARILPGIDLRPSVTWSHDVSGYSPGPASAFVAGRKAVTLGLDAEYQDTYSANLTYSTFFGGRYNTQVDRDFLALTLGVHF